MNEQREDLAATPNDFGGPNAPPAIEGKWLYILSKQGLVSCLDKSTGEPRGRPDLAQAPISPIFPVRITNSLPYHPRISSCLATSNHSPAS
jgi:hypothetical protein